MKKTIVSILMISSIVGITSCGKKTDTAQPELATETVPKVRVATLARQDVPQTAEFTTTVAPEAKNNIAGTTGRIKQIFVEVGDRVSKGQKLVQMDDANVVNLQTQIANVQNTYNRVKELFAVGGASQQDLDNAKMQLDVAETNLKNLQENTFLLSPLNGIVTARNFDAGDVFGGQAPILTVMQINPVKLKINVSESYYNKVKKGMSVAVLFDVLDSKHFTGKVNLIYPTIDEMTRTFTVEIALSNSNSEVRPGMYGRVLIDFGVENRIVVSDKAIVKQQGTNDRYVFVLNADNTVSYKQVTLGRRLSSEYEILSGLNEGEKVVTDGIAGLIDGKKVVVIDN